MQFESTYEVVADSPASMPWPEYETAIQTELDALLASECAEPQYQALLESHPSLLPTSYGAFGQGHHGLVHGAVVSQPRLTGLNAKIPDFLMITRDSGSVYPVLIEIESPCKTWFTKSGQPTADLTQAMNQLRHWKSWFKQAGNVERFMDEYRIPYDFQHRSVEPRYVLIYGRRAELRKSGFAHTRVEHQQPDEKFLSYDALRPNPLLADTVTATVRDDGYHALRIPPTLRLGPFQAEDLVTIKGKEAAVRQSPLITPERAEFLASRFGYWDDWARSAEGVRRFETE